MIELSYDDFKMLANVANKRIFYYIDVDTATFYFLTEGQIFKSIIPKSVIDENENFF